MNFPLIKVKILFVFLGLLLLNNLPATPIKPLTLDESGIPFIQRFPFPDFILSSGRFSVYEDSSGIFLIGAKDKVIVFYGNEFIPLGLNGQVNISASQKSLFYTGFNSLGLIKLYKNSQPQIIPLVDEKFGNNKGLGQINKVYVVNELNNL